MQVMEGPHPVSSVVHKEEQAEMAEVLVSLMLTSEEDAAAVSLAVDPADTRNGVPAAQPVNLGLSNSFDL